MTERQRIENMETITRDQAAVLDNFWDYVMGDKSAMKRPLPPRVEREAKHLIDGEEAAS